MSAGLKSRRAELVSEENVASRQRYISLTNHVDDLRFELNELTDGDSRRDGLARRIDTLNRERREMFGDCGE